MDETSVIEGKLAEPRGIHAVRGQEAVDLCDELFSCHGGGTCLENSNLSIGNSPSAPLDGASYAQGMYSGWRARLHERMVRLGYTKKSLSQKAGLSDTAVHDILDRPDKTRSPGIEAIQKLGNVLGMSLAELIDGEVRPPTRVPVIAELEADSVSSFKTGRLAQRPIDIVDMPSSNEDLVAVRVLGNSMAPRFQNGDRLIGSRTYGNYADNYIGMTCIIKTADEQMYVKVLNRGDSENTYTLRSYDPAAEDIRDVTLLWFAPIVAILPRA